MDSTLTDKKGVYPIAVILYARVSTSDQNIDHQVSQAEQAGFKLDHVIADDGVSGVATKLRDRPQGRRLFDMLRAGDVLVTRWVDRLGRDYNDVTDTIRHLMVKGVIVETVINRMRFDGATTDPIQQAVRDALIAFMAATAQAQAEATKSAQKAGIAVAKDDATKYRGRRPSYDRQQFEGVRMELNANPNISAIAKQFGLSRQTVLRIRDNGAEAEAALHRWGN